MNKLNLLSLVGILLLQSCGFKYDSESNRVEGDPLDGPLNSSNTVMLDYRIKGEAVDQHSLALLSKNLKTWKQETLATEWDYLDLQTLLDSVQFAEGKKIKNIRGVTQSTQLNKTLLSLEMEDSTYFKMLINTTADWVSWENQKGEVVILKKNSSTMWSLSHNEEVISIPVNSRN